MNDTQLLLAPTRELHDHMILQDLHIRELNIVVRNILNKIMILEETSKTVSNMGRILPHLIED